MRKFQGVAATALIVLWWPAAAAAQASDGESVIEAVTACRAINEPAERLRCYDRASDVLQRATSNNELTVMSREEVNTKRRSLFGLSVDDRELFGQRARKFEPVQSLDSTVTRRFAAGRDVYTVILADGSVWRTLEQARIDPEVGDPVHIRRGAMNGYFGSFKGARSVRIERTR